MLAHGLKIVFLGQLAHCLCLWEGKQHYGYTVPLPFMAEREEGWVHTQCPSFLSLGCALNVPPTLSSTRGW